MKRILCFLIGLGVCLFSFQLIVTYLNDGFTLKKIKSDEPFNAKWEVNNPPVSTIEELLNQKFYYLGKGSQCYVFESEDRKTVLKFFKHNRYRIPKISNLILYPQFLAALCQKQKEDKEKKRDALFQSCTIAFEELRDDSNLIYLHLHSSKKG
jgi:hypothetical protein